jgi:hypothetical protein
LPLCRHFLKAGLSRREPCSRCCIPTAPLMEESGLVDWTKAWAAIKKCGYDGWFAFETPHATPEKRVEETRRNIEWVMESFG